MVSQEKNARFNQTQGSVWLDALRGIAALLVLLQHWRYIFFTDFHDIHAHRALYILPYLITAAGRGAVILFFVLSGLLVGGSAVRSFQQRHWSWRRYLIHRFCRLWVALLPALLLGAIWDTLRAHLSASPAHGITFRLLFANMFFLQGRAFACFGSNNPLWSLSYEFWYYLLFPLGLCAVWNLYRPTIRIVSLVFLGVVAVLIGRVLGLIVLEMFPAWLIGAGLHYLPRIRYRPKLAMVSSVFYAIAFFAVVALKAGHPYVADILLAVLTGTFLWVLTSDVRIAQQHRSSTRISRGLAGFSFTLYVVHMPLLLVFASLLLHNHAWFPDMPHLAGGLAVLIVVLVYAWLVAQFTECRTDGIRHWIERRILHTR